MSDYKAVLENQRTKVIAFVKKCILESRTNEKEPRRPQNRMNWDYVNGNVDWSHKRPEELPYCVHLHKIGIAAERIRAKFKGALVNYDKWISVESDYDSEDTLLPSFVARSLLLKQLSYADAKTKISDALLCGAVEARMTLKVSGKYVTKPRFAAKSGKLVKEEKQVWQLDLPVLQFEQYHTDTANDDKLFQIEEFLQDYYAVLDIASDEQSSDKPLRLEAVKSLSNYGVSEALDELKHAKNNTTEDVTKFRKRIMLHNFFGTILDDDGSILEWQMEDGKKFPLRNVFCVLGNEKELLVDPQRNTRYSGKAPYVSTVLLRIPGGGLKALLDAGVIANRAEDELFTLMLCGAVKSVHNTTWGVEDRFADKKQVSGGMKDGDHIWVESGPGEPMGVLKTGEVPPEAFNMQNVLDRVLAENVISNQIDMSGTLPGKQVRATELVAAGTAISDVFDAISSDIEDTFIEYLAEESFYEIIQHIDEVDQDEVRACFGSRQDLADQFLALSAAERFSYVEGRYKFKGKGLKGLIANAAKAQALINLINTITANPITFQAVESQVSAAKIVQEIAKGLGIDMEKIQPDAQERAMIEQKQLVREQALAQAELEGRQTQGAAGQTSTSQGSQASGMQPGSGQGSVR